MTTAEDAAETAGNAIGTWLKALGGTTASGVGAVGAQAADPEMAWWSAVFALATAGMTLAFVGARVVATCLEIGVKWEAWRQARLQRRAEHRMLSDLGLASTFPDGLDTRPQVYAQEARRPDA